MQVRNRFFKYVSQNILGMIGISLYILADTFFISKAVGTDGITALNLVLPVYSLIFAIGAMIGSGSAIRYTIAKSRGEDASHYFFNGMFFATVIGIIFMTIGLFGSEQLVKLLGGDPGIVQVGASYTRIFMLFAPCFMWNHICNAFVRNDGAPSVAMMATLCSSLFNIVMDYILMFPLGLGMDGAALATACSPLVGVAICLIHFKSRKCGITFTPVRPSIRNLVRSCQVGVSAFIGEISSGVITIAFNFIILKLAGNVGVAAYGVVANTSLVAVAIFNGVSQGGQPLISEFYGKADQKNIKIVTKLSMVVSLALAVLLLLVAFGFAEPITAVFNSGHNPELASYATQGLRLYFIGFLFAGINITGTGCLSAVEEAKEAFMISIMRGMVAIILYAFLLAWLFGMPGVWLAFPTAELSTIFLTVITVRKSKNLI